MKLARRLLTMIAGLAVGLALVEGACWWRDGGAFPHLNVYRADKHLGVRLRPNSTERISFSGNPITHVRINASGYRGAPWPTYNPDEIFVVGDSQAFGLGVEEEQSFAQRLGALTKRPVANGAVPTYGPTEYNAVLAEELPKRKPKTVVYTINLANDLFEVAHDNPTRHSVWDGWAVRKETAPVNIPYFPGRRLLFGQSHAVFALRGVLFKWEERAGSEVAAVPSEGSWTDIVHSAEVRGTEAKNAQQQSEAQLKARADKLRDIRIEMRKLDAELGKTVQAVLPAEEVGPSTLRTAKASPGDIVRVFYGEGSQAIPLLAAQIATAADVRKRFEQQLRAKNDKKTLADLAHRDQLSDEEKLLLAGQLPLGHSQSPLRAHLARAEALCREYGAELVVLVLPLDVQVSAKEWDKYPHATRVDMTNSRVLADDVVQLAEELKIRAVDAWPVLQAAEPDAFLKGDLHMTPKGHDAVAQAIAKTLATAVPVAHAAPLPLGRTAVPTVAMFTAAPRSSLPEYYSEVDFKRLGCGVSAVNEWMWFHCKGSLMRLLRLGHVERLLLNTNGGSSLVAAIREGDALTVNVVGHGHAGFIRVSWALGEPEPEMGAYEGSPSKPTAPPLAVTEAENTLCACHMTITGATDCSLLHGDADASCMSTYAGDCASLLRCARGERERPPRCAAGVATGVVPRCPVAAVAPVAPVAPVASK